MNKANGINWKKMGPLEFIALLQKDPAHIVAVPNQTPPGWITRNHAEQLLTLLDSEKPASPVMQLICPSMPEPPSTVGRQAAYLLEGFLERDYPPSGNSDLFWASAAEMREKVKKEFARPTQKAFKGWELYSWNEKEGGWIYALVPGTNRNKTEKEIKLAQEKYSSKGLAARFRELAVGEHVTWAVPGNMGLSYPAKTDINDIRFAAERAGINLYIADHSQK